MAAIPTLVDFIASVPGSMFNAAPAALVNAALTEAADQTSSTVYGRASLTQKAVFLKAAIALLRHPSSINMRASNPDQMMVWEFELMDLQRAGTIGLRSF